MSNEWKKIGSLRKSKDPNKDNYIRIDANITLTAEDIVYVQDPRKRLDKLVAAGKLGEEAAAEMKAKVPEFILRELVLAPKR